MVAFSPAGGRRRAIHRPIALKPNSGNVARPYVNASSPTRARAPAGMLPLVVADATSIEPRATEWLAAAKPSWRKTSTATAGTAHATAGNRRLNGARLRTSSNAARPVTAAIQIQALVAVKDASTARSAATFIRPRTAARAPAVSSAVKRGSTTADPDVNKKTGFSARSTTERRAWRAFGARA